MGQGGEKEGKREGGKEREMTVEQKGRGTETGGLGFAWREEKMRETAFFLTKTHEGHKGWKVRLGMEGQNWVCWYVPVSYCRTCVVCTSSS